jgi:transcriptional regulator with PAS, ATPase and Fis domain
LLIGSSPQIQDMRAYIRRVAATDSNALITGETGAGKELVAALIHQQSPRREKPFIAINCAAIPDSLLESELFGYERGAFTGAERLQEGVLRSAAGGTVFFDEIGDMSPYAQAKILRAIESKEARRLGGKNNLPLDIRVVAATNRNLETLVAEGKFRADLYFRLNVANVQVPPLRERKEDLLLLTDHYIHCMNARFGQRVEGLTEEVLACFLRYDWPGNVRELKNLIEAIFINHPLQRIAVADLPEQFRRRVSEGIALSWGERDRLLHALCAAKWNKRLAAQKLQWSRMTLYRKMRKYQIVRAGQDIETSVDEDVASRHSAACDVTSL